MRVLYVHQNYPAQFGHLAVHLQTHYSVECAFLTARRDMGQIPMRVAHYTVPARSTHIDDCVLSFDHYIRHARAVLHGAAEQLRNFAPGRELDDWLDAEAEIDRQNAAG